jgi:hypothetical protein
MRRNQIVHDMVCPGQNETHGVLVSTWYLTKASWNRTKARLYPGGRTKLGVRPPELYAGEAVPRPGEGDPTPADLLANVTRLREMVQLYPNVLRLA